MNLHKHPERSKHAGSVRPGTLHIEMGYLSKPATVTVKFGLPHLAEGLQHVIPLIGDNALGVRLWQCKPPKTN